MAAARAATDPRDRLVVEVLARTGLRAGELCDLDADAVVLHRRRPLAARPGRQTPQRPLRPAAPRTRRRCSPTGPPTTSTTSAATVASSPTTAAPSTVTSSAASCAASAATPASRVHPHQLRHTLATQAINRGMRLEAIAALLGHRSMEMTLTYARIADRVVADEYAAVTAQIDALYGQPLGCPPTRDRGHDPTAPRGPRPHARQRALHPPRRARLPHGIRLRDLQPTSTPDPSSSPSCSANATTPATTTNPTAPPSSTASSNASRGGLLTTITRITPVQLLASASPAASTTVIRCCAGADAAS